MSSCRFFVDECVPSSLIRGLRRRIPGVSVLQVGDTLAPPKGTPDSELLKFCEREKRLLITADRATLPDFVIRHLEQDRHTWGVFVVGSHVALGHILDELELVYEASEDTEWIDVLSFLPFFHE